MKKHLFFVLLIAALLLSACSPAETPQVGSIVKIPDNTEALQVKPDRSGLDSCSLPEQEIEVSRNTFWDTSLGSAGYDRISLSQITVSQYGDCDKYRSVFIEDGILIEIME